MSCRPDPRVSVIVPAYRAGRFLPRAIASVQAQTLTDWELIVIDDFSNDDTLAIARRFSQQDERICVVAQPCNGGAAKARNAGLKITRGRYIAFLDADDSWASEKLARQVAFMERVGAALSYTGFWRVKGGRVREVHVPASVDYHRLLQGNIIGCLTAMYDREKLGLVPMPEIRMRQDYALWLLLLKCVPLAHGLREPLATYHVQSGSLSSNRFRGAVATWRLYRDIETLDRLTAARCLSSHLFSRLRRG